MFVTAMIREAAIRRLSYNYKHEDMQGFPFIFFLRMVIMSGCKKGKMIEQSLECESNI